MTLEEILQEYDNNKKNPMSEWEIEAELRGLVTEDISSELKAEVMAFSFVENVDSHWGTYFGPMVTSSNGDGTVMEAPSIQLVDEEMIDYWLKRGKESKNPILKARYLGLVFDFKQKITKKKVDVDIVKEYINSLIDTSEDGLYKHDIYVFKKLERAIKIAISYKDQLLTDKAKKAIIDFQARVDEDDKPGLWVNAFDILLGNKNSGLTQEESNNIIEDLENKFKSNIDLGNPKSNRWAAEAAVNRLISYYKKNKLTDNVEKLISDYGSFIEELVKKEESSLHATNDLESLYKFYITHGKNDKASNVLVKIRQLGGETLKEMKPISRTFSVDKEEIDDYVDVIVSGSKEEFFEKLIRKYIQSKENVEDQLKNISKDSPLQFILTRSLQDDSGRIVATIGPLDQDQEGHTIHQMSQNMSISALFLRAVIERAKGDGLLTIDNLMSYISQSVVLLPNRLSIIRRGLEAYLNEDYLVAIHLLIPQIEEGVRNIVEIQNGNIMKAARSGGFHLKTFDEIIRDPLVLNVMGENFVYYFRVLFTEPRGWNLRNDVCHGISIEENFTTLTADRVLHALLCLSIIREVKDEE